MMIPYLKRTVLQGGYAVCDSRGRARSRRGHQDIDLGERLLQFIADPSSRPLGQEIFPGTDSKAQIEAIPDVRAVIVRPIMNPLAMIGTDL